MREERRYKNHVEGAVARHLVGNRDVPRACITSLRNLHGEPKCATFAPLTQPAQAELPPTTHWFGHYGSTPSSE